MKKQLTLIATVLFLSFTATAAPITIAQAIEAGKNFLVHYEKIGSTLDFRHNTTLYAGNGANETACIYIIDIDTIGFILMSADDRSKPVLGYSLNGTYSKNKMPVNFESWVDGQRNSIARGVTANAPTDGKIRKEWDQLINNTLNPYTPGKAVDMLLTSQWEQGSGYNLYCPVNEYGSHVVVGCVATAMAQIFRYYEYPSYGFGAHSYTSPYGYLSVTFDTAHYDYSQMPDRIRYNSTNAQRHAVSQLCYHCGVAVDMIYQNPNHNTGSGAYMTDVPEAVKHFGYFHAVQKHKGGNDSEWMRMVRSELDLGRPLEYSGNSTSGGHAFVCDGYKDYGDLFHFNWGWGGYADGYYTLTTMQGFTSDQNAIFDMYPSGVGSNCERYYISPDGSGNGTSWQNCSGSYSDIFTASQVRGKEVWMKEGVYYGDTSSQTALTIPAGVTLRGGFAGTEDSASQVTPEQHPSIIDGNNIRQALLTKGGSTNTYLYNLTIRNGLTTGNANSAVDLGQRTQIYNCLFINNNGVEKPAINMNTSVMDRSRIHNNSGSSAIKIHSGRLRNCLITNNNTTGVECSSTPKIVNCNILLNDGYGITLNGKSPTVTNSIIWGNTETFDRQDGTNISFCATSGDSAYIGDGNITLPNDFSSSERGIFVNPISTIGETTEFGDWHLTAASPCVNAGDSNRSLLTTEDLDGNKRLYGKRVDIGCYESQFVNISTIEEPITWNIHPNPAQERITITGNSNNLPIRIYDEQGRLLSIHQNREDIDISNLIPGLYIIAIGNGTHKLIKR